MDEQVKLQMSEEDRGLNDAHRVRFPAVVQSLSRVSLLATPWTAALQASGP